MLACPSRLLRNTAPEAQPAPDGFATWINAASTASLAIEQRVRVAWGNAQHARVNHVAIKARLICSKVTSTHPRWNPTAEGIGMQWNDLEPNRYV